MDTLPIELIIRVVEELASDRPVSNLYALKRTSHFFSGICLPFIHRSVTLCAQATGAPLRRTLQYFDHHPNTRPLVHTVCVRGEALLARPLQLVVVPKL